MAEINQLPKTYCIAGPLRRATMERRLRAVDLPYSIVEAIQGGEKHKNYGVAPGEAGRYASHLAAMEQFIADGGQEAFIVEDDVLWHNQFKERWIKVRANISPGCQLVKLLVIEGCNTNFVPWGGVRPEEENLKVINRITCGSAGYWLRRDEALRVVKFYDRPVGEIAKEKKGIRFTADELLSSSTALMVQPPLLAEDLTQSTVDPFRSYRFHYIYYSWVKTDHYVNCDPAVQRSLQRGGCPCPIYCPGGGIQKRAYRGEIIDTSDTAEALRRFAESEEEFALIIRDGVDFPRWLDLVAEMHWQIQAMRAAGIRGEGYNWLGLSHQFQQVYHDDVNVRARADYVDGALISRDFLREGGAVFEPREGVYTTRRFFEPCLGQLVNPRRPGETPNITALVLASSSDKSKMLLSSCRDVSRVLACGDNAALQELRLGGTTVTCVSREGDSAERMNSLLEKAYQERLGEWLLLVNGDEYFCGDVAIRGDVEVQSVLVRHLDSEYVRPLVVKNSRCWTVEKLLAEPVTLIANLTIRLDEDHACESWNGGEINAARQLWYQGQTARRGGDRAAAIKHYTRVTEMKGAPTERFAARNKLIKLKCGDELRHRLEQLADCPHRLEPYWHLYHKLEGKNKELATRVLAEAPLARNIPEGHLKVDVELYRFRFDFEAPLVLYYAGYRREAYQLASSLLPRNMFGVAGLRLRALARSNMVFYESGKDSPPKREGSTADLISSIREAVQE